MQELFEFGGFVLRKWKSSELVVHVQIPRELVDNKSTQSLNIDHFTKVLGRYTSTCGFIAEAD